jgi:hypothetical protein
MLSDLDGELSPVWCRARAHPDSPPAVKRHPTLTLTHHGTSRRLPRTRLQDANTRVPLQTDSIPASSIRRIAKELNQLRASPPEGIRVVVNDEDISQFTAWVQGPGQSIESLGVSYWPSSGIAFSRGGPDRGLDLFSGRGLLASSSTSPT